MTALNWEKDRTRHLQREMSYDDLPRTGSWADRQRYYATPSTSNRSSKNYRSQSSNVVTRDRQHEFDQLNTYLRHAQQPDFRKKASVQREEIIAIVRRLMNKCQYWEPVLSRQESNLIQTAKAFLKAQAH